MASKAQTTRVSSISQIPNGSIVDNNTYHVDRGGYSAYYLDGKFYTISQR